MAIVEASDPQVIEAVKDKAGEKKRLPCAVALAVARDLDVPPAEIGRLCNELDIKIVGCQLGCF